MSCCIRICTLVYVCVEHQQTCLVCRCCREKKKCFIDWKLFAHCFWPQKKNPTQWGSFKTSQGHHHTIAHTTISLLVFTWCIYLLYCSKSGSHYYYSLIWEVIFLNLRFEMRYIWSNWRGQNCAWILCIVSLWSHCTLSSCSQIHCPVHFNLQRTWGQVYPCVYIFCRTGL